MYRIRFAPYLTTPTTQRKETDCSRVYSEDINEIHLFLKQHNFDLSQTFIENIPSDMAEDDYLEDNLLRPYQMKSNVDKEIRTIMTTRNFVNLTVSYVVEELGQFLLFGETILRNDIQLIQLVREILGSMPCTTILDFDLLSGELLDYACNTDWMYVKKTIDQVTESPSCDGQDLSELYEMIDRECNYDILPFTLEAYAEVFARIILGKYVGNLDDGDYAWR